MIERFLDWLKQPSTIASLIVAACLMVVGHYLNANNMFRGLTNFTAYLERSLTSFDAVNIGKVYYEELTGCQIVLESHGFRVACEPAPSLSDHLQKSLKGEREPGLITGIFVAFINTLRRIGNEATWLGIVIYVLSFAAGGYWLARKLDVATSGPAGWLVWFVLAPAVASVIALGLRWLLLLFVKLFSPVLAGIAWVLAYFATPFKWLGYGVTLVKTAKDIQSVGQNLSSVEPPKNPPNA
jgi:hypothetical protein